MDSPILPDGEDEEKGREQARYLRWGAKLRVLAAAVALVGAIVGLVSRLDTTHSSAPDYPAVQAIDAPTIFYGDPTSPAALRPGKANDAARVVCHDEVRYEPTSGHWHCAGYVDLGTRDMGRVPRDPGGPCTHRVAGANSPAWKCITKSAVPEDARNSYPGPPEHGVIFGGMHQGSDFCSEEARAGENHGAWSCTNWRPIPRGFRFIEATAPPGPCAFRAADQQTGEWSCNPPVPGL